MPVGPKRLSGKGECDSVCVGGWVGVCVCVWVWGCVCLCMHSHGITPMPSDDASAILIIAIPLLTTELHPDKLIVN